MIKYDRTSTLCYVNCAVTQPLMPLARFPSQGPAVPAACNLIQGRYCSTHLPENHVQSPQQASETAWPAGLQITPLLY